MYDREKRETREVGGIKFCVSHETRHHLGHCGRAYVFRLFTSGITTEVAEQHRWRYRRTSGDHNLAEIIIIYY